MARQRPESVMACMARAYIRRHRPARRSHYPPSPREKPPASTLPSVGASDHRRSDRPVRYDGIRLRLQLAPAFYRSARLRRRRQMDVRQ